jgi:hypothetical protein
MAAAVLIRLSLDEQDALRAKKDAAGSPSLADAARAAIADWQRPCPTCAVRAGAAPDAAGTVAADPVAPTPDEGAPRELELVYEPDAERISETAARPAAPITGLATRAVSEGAILNKEITLS